MQKQALVHLHALCALLRADLESREEIPSGTFERYDELNVSPSAIYRRKDAHRRANRYLLRGLASAVESGRTLEPETAATDGGTDPPRDSPWE